MSLSLMEQEFAKELIEAIENDDIDAAERLLDHGDVINWKDISGGKALIWAVSKNRSNIVKLLLEKNVDVNSQYILDSTPLMIASMAGRDNIVDLLLEKGAIIDFKNSKKETAIDWARENGHMDIASKLEKAKKIQGEKVSWKERENELQSVIQNLTSEVALHVGQIEQLKQEQQDERKRAENIIISLKTCLKVSFITILLLLWP